MHKEIIREGIIKAPIYLYNPAPVDIGLLRDKYALRIPGYPPEEFRYVYNFENVVDGMYVVTSYGRVFNTYGSELSLRLDSNRDGGKTYVKVLMCCVGNAPSRLIYVHRLVAHAFIPRTEEDISLGRDDVNHIYNRDGRCNYLWNLEWITPSENNIHMYNFKEEYDLYMFNVDWIYNRQIQLANGTFRKITVNSLLYEYQVHLICIAHTRFGYNSKECAYYAWLDPDDRNTVKAVRSILYGDAWTDISRQYGIIPKVCRNDEQCESVLI